MQTKQQRKERAGDRPADAPCRPRTPRGKGGGLGTRSSCGVPNTPASLCPLPQAGPDSAARAGVPPPGKSGRPRGGCRGAGSRGWPSPLPTTNGGRWASGPAGTGPAELGSWLSRTPRLPGGTGGGPRRGNPIPQHWPRSKPAPNFPSGVGERGQLGGPERIPAADPTARGTLLPAPLPGQSAPRTPGCRRCWPRSKPPPGAQGGSRADNAPPRPFLRPEIPASRVRRPRPEKGDKAAPGAPRLRPAPPRPRSPSARGWSPWRRPHARLRPRRPARAPLRGPCAAALGPARLGALRSGSARHRGGRRLFLLRPPPRPSLTSGGGSRAGPGGRPGRGCGPPARFAPRGPSPRPAPALPAARGSRGRSVAPEGGAGRAPALSGEADSPASRSVSQAHRGSAAGLGRGLGASVRERRRGARPLLWADRWPCSRTARASVARKTPVCGDTALAFPPQARGPHSAPLAQLPLAEGTELLQERIPSVPPVG